MFFEILKTYRQELFDYRPCCPITERDAWQMLDSEWKTQSIALGEKYLNYQFPNLLASDFTDFSLTGNRIRFEDKFFAKRRALDALVLAECIEDDGRFMNDIINGIFSICEESSWCLPAHNTYVRDMPQLPLPDLTNPILDLFACETGAVLSMIYYLLKDRLEHISPFISKRILSELQHRIFTPYLGCHFWWMGNGKEPMNNWTIWCTQNVLLGVFLTSTDSAFKKQVLEKACKSADYFLAEYGEDGCCDEGAQYYRHAALCLFQVLEIVNEVTNHAFQTLYSEPKIKNIASYILNVHIHDKYYVNFADCSPIAGRAGTREYLFAKRTANNELLDFAAQEFVAGGRNSLLLPEESNLYYRLNNGIHAAEIKAHGSCCNNTIPHPDIYYPSVGLFIVRDDTLCLAVKAGDNDDSHNHNDTGSFTIYKNGLPMFIDVGVGSYTKKTFSPRRYEIWTMQSAFHNLPTINGTMQAAGESYRSTDVRWKIGQTECEIEMELAGAYPKEAGLHSYRRHVILQKGEKIIIKDSFTLDKNCSSSQPVVLSLMTSEKPTLVPDDNGFTLEIGSLGRLQFFSGNYLRTETIPLTDEKLVHAWNQEVFRTLVAAEANSIEMHIR